MRRYFTVEPIRCPYYHLKNADTGSVCATDRDSHSPRFEFELEVRADARRYDRPRPKWNPFTLNVLRCPPSAQHHVQVTVAVDIVNCRRATMFNFNANEGGYLARVVVEVGWEPRRRGW